METKNSELEFDFSIDSIRMALDENDKDVIVEDISIDDGFVLQPDPEFAAKAKEEPVDEDSDMHIYESKPEPEPAPEPEPEVEPLPDIDSLVAELKSMEESVPQESAAEASEEPEGSEAEEPAEDVEDEDADEEAPQSESAPKAKSGKRAAPAMTRAATSAGKHAAKSGGLKLSAASLFKPSPKSVGTRSKGSQEKSYAEDRDYSSPVEPEDSKAPVTEKRSFSEMVVRPVIGALSVIGMKIGQSKSFFAAAPIQEEADLGHEVPLPNAAKFYELRLDSLRARMKLSFLFTAILMYISFGLPVFGALRYTTVAGAVCVILMLTVMILGLDVITSGLTAIGRKRLNANSLVALSCIFSFLDGLLIACGVPASGLPFCAVSALTVTLTLLGSVLNSEANKNVFRTANSAKRRYTLSSESDITEGCVTLLKSRRGTKGFVRRTEEAGPDEIAFSTMAPFVIPAALVFTLVASIISGNWAGFAHTLSGVFVFAAPATILFSFALPFFVSSEALADRGACIAGWSGLYDLGKSNDIIITDRDLFSRDDVIVKQPRILEGTNAVTAVSMTASIMRASGCAMSHAFDGLLDKVNGSLMEVDEFKCHESGGLVALIEGKEVLCGPSAFMQLMGIRLPDRISRSNCVYLAVNGSINAIFEMQYTADEEVKNSLMDLMESNRHPIFAIRDFNISSTMLADKFSIYTDGFDFPSFSRRYAISAAGPSEYSKPAAVLSQEGFSAYVKLADHSRRLFNLIRISTIISVASSLLGMLIMFILSAGGKGFGVTGALIYMLAALLPEIILSLTFKAD